MATSFFALFDDIALLLDDVSVMAKVAAKKTSGVLGDDIALNANQVTGFSPNRELPVVWAVAKGSMINKAILVPLALAIVIFAPWSLTPLLMVGGAYLCFEGVEKLFHVFLHSRSEDRAHHESLVKAVSRTDVDMVALEKEKIRAAVRTDAILSGEIIAISLGTMQSAPLPQQAAALVAVAVLMTVGVYGLVAAIVKLDDGGMLLAAAEGPGALAGAKRGFGRFILRAAPYLMKTLSVVGTAAMFLVGGGIIAHGVPAIEHLAHALADGAATVPVAGTLLAALAPAAVNLVAGIIVGTIVLLAWTLLRKLTGARQGAH